jgi:deoxyribose-phosphate aldolase
MLTEISEANREVGIKPSGGIATLEDAARYIDLADQIMGPDWATPARMRLGASRLLDALLDVV